MNLHLYHSQYLRYVAAQACLGRLHLGDVCTPVFHMSSSYVAANLSITYQLRPVLGGLHLGDVCTSALLCV